MWDVPRYRIRAYLRSLHRHRSESRSAPLEHRFRIKRTQAEILVGAGLGKAGRVIPARVVLNDLSPASITLFSSEPLGLDDRVQVTLRHPKLFYVTGLVNYCRMFSLGSRVFSSEGRAYPYRVQIQFVFRTREERAAVQEYIQSLTSDLFGVAS